MNPRPAGPSHELRKIATFVRPIRSGWPRHNAHEPQPVCGPVAFTEKQWAVQLGWPLPEADGPPPSPTSVIFHADSQGSNAENRHERQATWWEENPDGRWRMYTYDELMARDKVNMDIFWLRDESLEETANLPDPEVFSGDRGGFAGGARAISKYL